MNEHAHLDSILERLRSGEASAIDELQGLSLQHPGSKEILGHLAWAHTNAHQHADALEVYRRCREIDPDDPEIGWRMGDRQVNLGLYQEAAETYEAVLKQHPGCEDALAGVRYAQYLISRESGHQEELRPGPRSLTPRQEQNRRLNQHEYQRHKTRLKSVPADLYLESTTKCNFHCLTCSKGYDPYHAEDLNESILEKVRREIIPKNVRISITGFGEPTMAGNFDEIFQMAIDNGSLTHFVTNASLLSYARLEQLCRNPVNITISFDGSTKETFESIRAGANFDRILEKLAMIRKLRDIHLSEEYVRFSFNFVAVRQNIHELPEVVRIAHRYGMSYVNVADYALNSNEFDESSLVHEPEKANRYIEEARNLAGELGIDFNAPPPYLAKDVRNRTLNQPGLFSSPGRFVQRCASPWREPYIRTGGEVVPCCVSGRVMGDLGQKSFMEIWNGWKYRLFRLRIDSPMPPLECRTCFVNFGINGGNPGVAMSREGISIKISYWIEIKTRHLVNRLKKRFMNKPGDESGRSGVEPNFYRGRKITPRVREYLKKEGVL
jgi:MoaA/NifB/PqqE/SkfB family radical SAM enzyme